MQGWNSASRSSETTFINPFSRYYHFRSKSHLQIIKLIMLFCSDFSKSLLTRVFSQASIKLLKSNLCHKNIPKLSLIITNLYHFFPLFRRGKMFDRWNTQVARTESLDRLQIFFRSIRIIGINPFNYVASPNRCIGYL